MHGDLWVMTIVEDEKKAYLGFLLPESQLAEEEVSRSEFEF